MEEEEFKYEGRFVDNGLIPVLLSKKYKNFNANDIVGFSKKEVDWIVKHDGGVPLVKLSVMKDGLEIDGKTYYKGDFIALETGDAEKISKKGDAVSLTAKVEEKKKPSRPPKK